VNTFVCDPDDRHWLMELGITSTDRLMAFHPDDFAAVSGSSETFKVDLDRTTAAGAPRWIFVKRQRYRSWKELLRGCIRGTFFGKSRARLEFEVLSEMQRRGVRAVRPIAYAEKRRWRILRSCVLITEGAPETQTLSSYFSRCRPVWDLTTRRRFIRAAGRSVCGLHDAGVLHGGLFWRNVLVTETTSDGWTFTFLDPNRRCRLYSEAVPLYAAVSDLSDFASSSTAFQSRTDIARFLRSYEGPCRRKKTRKSAARAIARLVKKKTRHEGHRIAVGAAISWLQQRMQDESSAAGRVTFDSVEGFLASLESADSRGFEKGRCVIRFELLERGADWGTQVHSVTIDGHGVLVEQGIRDAPDLVIRTDADTLLAVINAQPGAFDAIRSGRFELHGDTRPLVLLAKLVEKQTASNRASGAPQRHEQPQSSCGV